MIVSVPTLFAPAFFFPNAQIFDVYDPSNVDPSTGATTNGVVRWSFFYLPFNITISRYRFQIDASGPSGVIYAGLYSALGALICDIGAVSIGTGSSQYGKGAHVDPGTNLYDANQNPTNAVYLPAGWYIYGWAASIASGTMTIPSMQSLNNTVFNEQIIADTTGLPSGILGRAGTNTTGVSGGHMPATIAQAGVVSNVVPMNITFFA